MWNLSGLWPDPTHRLRPAALALAVAVSLGAAACGPSNGTNAVYTIVFALGDSPEDLATLTFEVTYDGGNFVGEGLGVSCELVATEDDEAADFDDDDNGTLEIDIDASDNPLAAGNDIVTCEFQADTQPTANSFGITVTDAVDGSDTDVDPGDVDVVVVSTDLSQALSIRLGEEPE